MHARRPARRLVLVLLLVLGGGALAAGLAADLDVLDGDPRADPDALMRVAAVFQDGRRIRRYTP